MELFYLFSKIYISVKSDSFRWMSGVVSQEAEVAGFNMVNGTHMENRKFLHWLMSILTEASENCQG